MTSKKRDREALLQGGRMELDVFAENRESKQRNRAKRFFQMLSDQRRKAKEERNRETLRQRREDVYRKMQELQGEVKANQQSVHQSVEQVLERYSQPPLTVEPMIPYPPEPKTRQTTKPPVRPAQPHPADLDFWRWATGKEVEEEERPAWTWRNRVLYKGAKW